MKLNTDTLMRVFIQIFRTYSTEFIILAPTGFNFLHLTLLNLIAKVVFLIIE